STLLNNLNRNIAVNTTNFYWLTVDVDENAVTNHTISASTTLADVGFSVTVNKGGNLTVAGEQTIVANPNLAVPHDILLPTLFSPNNDGNNDRLTVKSLNIAEIDFQVFDRFGNIVFNTKNVQEATNLGWDGGNQPSGVYFWSVKAKFTDSVVNTQRGEINLIR
ncbi:MAG TPA: hypothetical protein DCM08_03140, partial [Microscillaceae bacterium]|nr:hypothetical protein [Microscillaceae bacterium]